MAYINPKREPFETGKVEFDLSEAACYFHFREKSEIKMLNLFLPNLIPFSKEKIRGRLERTLRIYAPYS